MFNYLVKTEQVKQSEEEEEEGIKYEPFLFWGEEIIWVLRVKLESFTDIRPAQSPWRKRKFRAFGRRESGEKITEETEEEEEEGNNKRSKEKDGGYFHVSLRTYKRETMMNWNGGEECLWWAKGIYSE